MKNYLEKFLSISQELKEKTQINIEKYHIYPPINESEIAKIEKKYDIRLPESVKIFYQQANGLSLEWILNPKKGGIKIHKGDYISGSIRILQLEQVFGGWDGKEWLDDIWFDWMDEDEKEYYKKLKPFDYFDNDDSGCVCFHVENTNLKQNLMLHSVDYGVRELGVNFETYLGMLLETRGYFRWQYLISPSKDFYNYTSFYRSFHYYMSQLFPETDFSKYTEG